MKLKAAAQATTVEVELTEATLAAIAIEANRAGVTVNDLIVSKFQDILARQPEVIIPEPDTVTVTHGFTATEWQRLESKARLGNCTARGLLTSTCDLLVDTEELVPCWIPQTTYNRLWQAVGAFDGDADGIAEKVLGDLVADPAALADILRSGWQISGEESAALDVVLAGWSAEGNLDQSP